MCEPQDIHGKEIQDTDRYNTHVLTRLVGVGEELIEELELMGLDSENSGACYGSNLIFYLSGCVHRHYEYEDIDSDIYDLVCKIRQLVSDHQTLIEERLDG